MEYGDENLRRKVLKKNVNQNVVCSSVARYNEAQIPHRTTSTSCTQYDIYINAALELWAKDPNPRELLNRRKWRKWILEVAEKKYEWHKFKVDSVLSSFVSSVMDMFWSTKHCYLHNASLKLDNDQSSALYSLKNDFEAEQDNKLLELATQTTSDDDRTMNDGDNSDDSVSVLEEPNSRPLKPFNNNPVSPKCSMEERSPDRIFKEISQSTVTLTRKRNKRSSINNTGSGTSEHDNTRKKHRSGENNRHSVRPLNALNIKIVPRNNTEGKLPCYSVEKEVHRDSYKPNQSVGGESKCVEGVEDDVFEFETSADYTYYNNDDEFIENATPPCSPACLSSTNDTEVVGRTGLTDSFKTKVSTSASNNSPIFQRKVSSSNIRNKLNSPTETKSTENRRVKGIRAQSKEPLTQTQSGGNKTLDPDDDHFELPDIDPPVDQDKENYPVSVDEIADKYPKPPTAPALTLEMFEVLKNALDKPPKEKIVSGFSLYILQEDLAVFNKDTEWLNDRNIDFYLELIRDRSTGNGYPRVYIFHSFFYTLLTDKDGGYEVVRETTGDDDLFQYDIVLFPVNLNQHWRLVVVKFQERTLKCYDSMRHDNSDVLKNIGRYLRKEYHRKHRNNLENKSCEYVSEDERSSPIPFSSNGEPVRTRMFFDSSNWTVENVSSETIPQQKNAIDCGIFVLQYAEYLSREKEFDFDQTHVSYFRKRMMYETLIKQLLTSSGNENIGIS